MPVVNGDTAKDKTTEGQNALVGAWENDHNNKGTWEEPPGPKCSSWRRIQQCPREELCGSSSVAHSMGNSLLLLK